MAWCENPSCGKTNLRKEDVEFDEAYRKVLCHGCYSRHHPGWMPPVEVVDCSVPNLMPASDLQYELSLTSADGFRAKLKYGEASIAFHAPIENINRWLKG